MKSLPLDNAATAAVSTAARPLPVSAPPSRTCVCVCVEPSKKKKKYRNIYNNITLLKKTTLVAYLFSVVLCAHVSAK